MEERFRDRYRVASTRLRDWNYASEGWYFVTFCTKDRECFLGDVEMARWDVSPAGMIVYEEIVNTDFHRPNIVIDSFVVMPNHVHMIIEIFSAAHSAKLRSGVKKTIPESISQIINQIKGVTTRRIRGLGIKEFCWQPRFYDHIIRNEQALNNLRQYIKDNPAKWEEDRNYAENIWM